MDFLRLVLSDQSTELIDAGEDERFMRLLVEMQNCHEWEGDDVDVTEEGRAESRRSRIRSIVDVRTGIVGLHLASKGSALWDQTV